MSELHVVDHPLVTHKLSMMRRRQTGSKEFRELLEEISMLMGYELTRDLPLEMEEIETPLARTQAGVLSGRQPAIVPILRAGLGMTQGLLRLLPAAAVCPVTHSPVEYYCKLPPDIGERRVILADPMLATGGSAADALDLLKRRGCRQIRLMCLVAAPEGVRRVRQAHPGVDIYTAALDQGLDDRAYIVPGLGDAGDRIFGTL